MLDRTVKVKTFMFLNRKKFNLFIVLNIKINNAEKNFLFNLTSDWLYFLLQTLQTLEKKRLNCLFKNRSFSIIMMAKLFV